MKLSTTRKQDDFGANVELINLLSNFYLLAQVGDKATLSAKAGKLSPEKQRLLRIYT